MHVTQHETASNDQEAGQSSPFQAVLQFRTGDRSQNASAWRHTFTAGGVLNEDEIKDLAIFSGETALSIIALNPRAGPVICARMTALAKAVAAQVGKPVVQELMEKRFFVREDGNIWDYLIPRWCVAKKEPGWSEMKTEVLSPAARRKLKTQAERSIADQAAAWGVVLPSPPCIGILEVGKPMPIAAISGARSGHGKPAHVLARVQVRVICNLRLNGDWFVGPMASLGFGRMIRDGAAAHNSTTDKLPAECALEFLEVSDE